MAGDEFDILVELGEALGYDADTARRFAVGRDGSERAARRRWEMGDPAIEKAVAQVVESARTGRLGMSIWEAEAHAEQVAEHWLATSTAPVGQRVAEVAKTLDAYARTLKIQEAPSGRDLRQIARGA